MDRTLALGAVPAAFGGVLVARAVGQGRDIETLIQRALGVALIIAAAGLFVRACMRLAERARHRDASRAADPVGPPRITIRPLPTVIVGVIGGLVVGMTSVGSGSLIIIALMYLYPTLRASELGRNRSGPGRAPGHVRRTGHLLFGDFQLGRTGALLVGSVPGAYIGATVIPAASCSSRSQFSPDRSGCCSESGTATQHGRAGSPNSLAG